MRLTSPTHDPEVYLALEAEASAPYMHFVYDTPEEASAIARFLWEGSVGELAAPYGALALDDAGAVVGMMAILDQPQLTSARTAAAMALLRGRKIDPAGRVRARMMLANDTLLSLQPDDLYLSRITVVAGARGRGHARWLMRELERQAVERGKRRVVLEVSARHLEASKLYEKCGFVRIDERRAHDNETGRELVYRHMEKRA